MAEGAWVKLLMPSIAGEDMACFLLSMRHRTLALDRGAMFEDL